jgi:hypothetical protein
MVSALGCHLALLARLRDALIDEEARADNPPSSMTSGNGEKRASGA